MKRKILLFGLFLSAITTTGNAAWTVDGGKLRRVEDVATLPGEEHYRQGCEAMNEGHWRDAVKHFRIATINFPHTPYGQDAHYFLGLSYYHLKEFDLANICFSSYLKCQTNPRYFQEAIEYKFSIAEQFRGGAKRRLMGSKKMPKWGSGTPMALEIYNEVIAAMPNDSLAIQALVGKASLHWQLKEYREAIEAFQIAIRRFPKHELTPECYVLINKVYLAQSQHEYQNSDILALAQVNLNKFERDFPREERLETARADVLSIKEIYARGLFETGKFYERIHKPSASVLYYQKTLAEFPDTNIAQRCRNRLRRIDPSLLEVDYNKPKEPELFDLEDDAPTLG